MSETEQDIQDIKPEGMSFITKLILTKVILIVIVAVTAYFSLRRI